LRKERSRPRQTGPEMVFQAKMGEKRNWDVETVLKNHSRFRIQIKEI
jgi:hypothetical protein